MTETEKIIPSPFGKLYLYAKDEGLTYCYFKRKSSVKAANSEKATQHLRNAEKALTSYFKKGTLDVSKIKIANSGTDFQKRVWKQLRKVKSGKTISYGELAEKVGSPKAARAAGTACGANPLLIITPCHRVIAADGSLGGFAAGLKIKEKLLNLESPKS